MMQGLREDDAIEAVGWNVFGPGKIRNDGRARLFGQIDDVTPRDAVFAKFERVGIIANLEYATANILRMMRQEILDVIPVHRCSTLKAKIPAAGKKFSEMALPSPSPENRCTGRAAHFVGESLAKKAREAQRRAGIIIK